MGALGGNRACAGLSKAAVGTFVAAALLATALTAPVAATSVAEAAAKGKAPKCLGKKAKIVGSKRRDRLRGTPGADVIYAGRGNDKIKGRGGNDRICGGSGRDVCDSASAEAEFKRCESFPLRVSGTVKLASGASLEGVPVKLSAGGEPAELPSGPDGSFATKLVATEMPIDVVAEISYDPGGGLPDVETGKRLTARGNEVDLGATAVPDVAASEIDLVNGAGRSDGGSVIVTGVPPEVERIFATAYDPDADPAAFPGAFEQEGGIPLNSAVFMWMAALDDSGAEIHDLSLPITARVKVPRSQWDDLEDVEQGNDTIDFPFYTYDEDLDTWVQEDTYHLEDSGGQALPPETEPELADGSFPGDVYAQFILNHLSWSNLDYAYNGPWTMTRMTDAQRQSSCVQRAVRVADAMIGSPRAQQAFAPLNKPGADLSVELAGGGGPEIKFDSLVDAWGEYRGDENGDRDDQVYLQDFFGDASGCASASADTRDDLTLFMAENILHETGHWKWHAKGGHDLGASEPEGEAGGFIDNRMWGGDMQLGDVRPGSDLYIGDEPISTSLRDFYLDPKFWKDVGPLPTPLLATKRARRGGAAPLELTVSLPQPAYALGEQITATVTYENRSSHPIRALDVSYLEGAPLWFDVERQGGGRSAYLGVRGKPIIKPTTDFTALAPGGTLQRSVDLIRAPDGSPVYDVSRTGSYQLTAHYSSLWGIEGDDSNSVNFNVTGGGGLGGTITDGVTGLPVQGAKVRVIDGTATRFSQDSTSTGTYSVPELPPGDYSVKAWAPRYRESTRTVHVNAGATADADLALDPFILSGNVRFVLDWSGAANFLPKLWLPAEQPVSQRGFVSAAFKGRLDACPFAHYDRESNTTERGPVILSVSRFLDGTYTLYTSRSIGVALSAGAQLDIYDETGLVDSIFEPIGPGAWWDLLRIDGATRQVTETNTLSATEPVPYATSFANCTTNG